MTTVLVEEREVYGTKLYYPANMEATAFARIANTKTLVPAVLHDIDLLGFKVVILDPEQVFTSEQNRRIMNSGE